MSTKGSTLMSRSLLAGFCGVAFGLYGTLASAGTIVGSKHDFSQSGWAGGEICVACHTPHNSGTLPEAPLWNHTVTAAVFDLYTSPTLQASVVQPDGSSKLCLSCHDGTVALDSFGGTVGGTYMSGNSKIGEGTAGGTTGDLRNDHPVSFAWDAALSTADGALFDPTVKVVTIGGTSTKTGTINDVMLIGGKLQCASCHDVHNKFTNGPKLLRIANTGSALCLTCHAK